MSVKFPNLLAATALMLAMPACKEVEKQDDRPETSKQFPQADRAVSQTGDTEFSTEAARDEAGEATKLMNWAAIEPGMTVADIGAGEGYYTVRLAERVGVKGRV
ncbi:MAG TPA: SAM-dependent methyltransferase, partial [Sphingorhabdus sp.]|nr:SAM-dependent methyltransferase [Sphingorhabdus sp.]